MSKKNKGGKTMDLKEIAEEIRTQDNLATADPFFILFDIEKVPSNQDYTDKFEYIWVEPDHELGETREELIEAFKEKEMELPKDVETMSYGDFNSWVVEHEDIDFWYYVEKWRFQGVFFTKKSAEAHMKANNYHYYKPFVYCVSLWRNPEMQTIRKALIEDRFIENEG